MPPSNKTNHAFYGFGVERANIITEVVVGVKRGSPAKRSANFVP